MKFKSKVRKQGERKSIEIPKTVRDNFDSGEEVNVEKIQKKTTIRNTKEM